LGRALIDYAKNNILKYDCKHMILPNIEQEKKLLNDGFNIVIGVDEVGRGPLAGPVVAGAVWVRPEILEEDFELRSLIRDSKKLSEKQREKIYQFINDNKNFVLGIGEISVEMIDELNILNASLLAMRVAIDEVMEKIQKQGMQVKSQQGCVLVDGNKNIANLKLKQKLFTKGDQRIFSIAVASIQAKVYRDQLMMKYHQHFPEYGFDKHKGYGTKFHIQQLNKIGACAIHRQSFAPVRAVLG
jgi:ribonuclease HII